MDKSGNCSGDFFIGGDHLVINRRGKLLQFIQILQVVWVVNQKDDVDCVTGG